jgi:acetyl esterase/lipase
MRGRSSILYRPAAGKGAAPGPLPIIVFIYGGSWQDGTREDIPLPGARWRAAASWSRCPTTGWCRRCIIPSSSRTLPPLCGGCGVNAARLGGDPDRIVMVGHSAGAYNGSMLALDPRWLGGDRAAIRGFVGLAGPYDFLPLDLAVTQAAFGREPDLPSTQPINHASAGDPPALLLHGAQDTTAYPRNSQKLAERLRAAGVAAEVKLYPDVGHVGIMTAISRPFRGRAPVLEDVTAFARRVTALAAPPVR